MNLMIEYTDEHYASKQEVAESLGKHLADPVWNQLCEYRRKYIMKAGSVEFCLCPGILYKMISFYELLHQMKADCSQQMIIESLFETSESLWMFQHVLKTSGDLMQRVHDICLMSVVKKEKEIIELMKAHQLPNIAKTVGVIQLCGKSETAGLLLGAVLNEFQMINLMPFIQPQDLDVSFEKDGTYVLEHLLNVWSLRMKKEISQIKLKQNKDMQHLAYQYPQLKNYQIQFYLNHHEPGFYYTIEQFVECSGVCYETGRCALKQMVDLGFYQMFKQGKKFVYTAR